jgi:hypothetical protein
MFKRHYHQYLTPHSSFAPLLYQMSDQSASAPIYDYNSRAVSPWHASDEDNQLPDLNQPYSPPSTPSLHYPSRLTTPDMIEQVLPNALRDGRIRERRQQSAVHAAMIARVPGVLGFPLEEAIRGFAPRSPRIGATLRTRLPSPEPIPIPPRIDTPFPTDILRPERTPTPPGPPAYPPLSPPYYGPRSPTPDALIPDYASRTSTPTTAVGDEVQSVLADEGLEIVRIEDLEPLAPGTPRPYVHPGGEWMTNLGDDGPIHDVMMRTEEGGEELELPPFFRYNFNTDDPELLTTFGRNCRVSTRPLRARPRPYPIQPFTRRQRLLFHPLEVHAPLVDQALDLERDTPLRAEVQRYRRQTTKMLNVARRLALLKSEYNSIRKDTERSVYRLAQADAYARVMPRVLREVSVAGQLSPPIVELGIRRVIDPRIREPSRRATHCGWCAAPSHDVDQCSMLRLCLHCGRWGHLEENCFRPHSRCYVGETCEVPRDHPAFQQGVCNATIPAARRHG